MCGVSLGSLIDAGLYLGPSERLTVSRPNPAIYLDAAYWSELGRRNSLMGGPLDLATLRQQQSVRFVPPSIPAELRCS
jgi:hypothetical protein